MKILVCFADGTSRYLSHVKSIVAKESDLKVVITDMNGISKDYANSEIKRLVFL